MSGNDSGIDVQPQGKFSIKEQLGRQTTAPAAPPIADPAEWPEAALPEPFEPLPTPGDPYQAHARPGNKPMLTLHCLLGDGRSRGISWGSFDSIDWLPATQAGSGPVIVLRMASLIPVEIVIEGRNLALLHSYLSQARVGWIRELSASRRGFAGGTEPIIERIGFRPVQPPAFT